MQYTEQQIQSLTDKNQDLWEAYMQEMLGGISPIALPLSEKLPMEAMKSLADQWRIRYRNVLLLGIGGSALGARTIVQFLRGPYYNLGDKNRPRLFILDNIDQAWMKYIEDELDFGETGLVYVSKSGSTPETAAAFLYYYDLYLKAGGKPEDVVIICDPADNGINRIVSRIGCRTFPIWPNLPGRYSVLSSAGLLPAELIGVDSAELIAGAQSVHKSITQTLPKENALCMLGLFLHDQAVNRGKTQHVLFNYSSLLADFGLWFAQLWGESLGKKFNLKGEQVFAGTTPLSCIGATDQHSLLQLFKEGPADKVFGFVRVEKPPGKMLIPGHFREENEYAYFAGKEIHGQMDIERLSTELCLVKSGQPCYGVSLPDRSASSLGAIMYFYQALVVWIARLWHIDPFNQPGVEEGKCMTYTLMGRSEYQSQLEAVKSDIEMFDADRRLFNI